MNRYFGTHTLEGEWHALLPRYMLLGDRVAGKRILDIGCGTGIGSSLLVELGAETVDGVDHRPEVLELARVKHDKQGLDFHIMFWEELEFPDDVFDMVVCLDPSSPVTDPNLLVEVRRVLNDGGEYVCALERSTVTGLESILPRYGYERSADEVTIGRDTDRVPQLGELSNYFESVVGLVQRPHVSYVFEADGEAAGETPEKMRRVPDEEGGLWGGGEESRGDGPREGGKWVPIDTRLSAQDTEVAGVEIFFCGDTHMPPPPMREVRLPYYETVERIERLVNDLQVRQGPGAEPSSFDEVVDEPAEAEDEGALTDWDRHPTGLHEPLETHSPGPRHESTRFELETRLSRLSSLYEETRRAFERAVRETEAVLSERDAYIDHLVRTIHQWEEHAQDSESSDFASERATTDVFEVNAVRSQLEQEPVVDDLSELDEGSEADELEGQIASLEAQQERLEEMLAEREARLAKLEAQLADADNEAEPADDEARDKDSEAEAADADDAETTEQ